MKIRPNDKAAQIRQMRRNVRALQNHQKNPAVMDALARGALEVARARIEELEAQLAKALEPPVCYAPCISHRFHNYSTDMQVTVAVPARSVCPICAGLAKNVSGPHFGPGLAALHTRFGDWPAPEISGKGAPSIATGSPSESAGQMNTTNPPVTFKEQG
jgi:hypothetical protein